MCKFGSACAAAAILILSSIPRPSQAETEVEALERAKAANSRGDYGTSAAIYRELEQRGSAAGARGIGLLYWAGAGVQKDHVRACDQFAKAEQGNDAFATEALGDCYHNGDGRNRDYARSAQLYAAAGDRGLPIAFCALGNQYLRGKALNETLEKLRRCAARALSWALPTLRRTSGRCIWSAMASRTTLPRLRAGSRKPAARDKPMPRSCLDSNTGTATVWSVIGHMLPHFGALPR